MVFMYTCKRITVYIRTHVYLYACKGAHRSVYMYKCKYMYTCKHMCIHVHTHICINVYKCSFQADPKAPAAMRTARIEVLNLRTTAQQKCGAIPRRARIYGSQLVVSLNSMLESSEKEEEGSRQTRKLRRRCGRHASKCLKRRTAAPVIHFDLS